jgi:ATP-dependent DNA ligase
MTFKAELLTELPFNKVEPYLSDKRYGVQEKFNGERRIILKEGDKVWNLNREGEKGKPLPPALVASLQKHHLSHFVIDAEICKDKLHIFDALVLGPVLLGDLGYFDRWLQVRHEFGGFAGNIEAADLALTKVDKLKFIIKIHGQNGEGFVIRRLDALYSQGRAENHIKVKFWKTLDAVTMQPSRKGHNSVEVGLYNHTGALTRICSVSLNGKQAVKIGQVVEIKYLYGTGTDHVVQPELLRVRDDKKPVECTFKQLVINKNFIK